MRKEAMLNDPERHMWHLTGEETRLDLSEAKAYINYAFANHNPQALKTAKDRLLYLAALELWDSTSADLSLAPEWVREEMQKKCDNPRPTLNDIDRYIGERWMPTVQLDGLLEERHYRWRRSIDAEGDCPKCAPKEEAERATTEAEVMGWEKSEMAERAEIEEYNAKGESHD